MAEKATQIKITDMTGTKKTVIQNIQIKRIEADKDESKKTKPWTKKSFVEYWNLNESNAKLLNNTTE